MHGEQLARQLTLMDFRYFKRLTPHEFIMWNKLKKHEKPERAPNIYNAIQKFNSVRVCSANIQPRSMRVCILILLFANAAEPPGEVRGSARRQTEDSCLCDLSLDPNSPCTNVIMHYRCCKCTAYRISYY